MVVFKKACILLVFMFFLLSSLSYGGKASFKVFRVELDDSATSDVDRGPAKDFFIDGGKADGLIESMVLDVYREKNIRNVDRAEDLKYSVLVGKVKVHRTFQNISSTRIVSLTSPDDTPVLAYRTVMLGDYAVMEKDEKGPVIMFPSKVLFDLNAYKIKPDAEEVLSSVLEMYSKAKDKDIIVEGHTCSMGSEKYNMELSKKRASSVRDFLKRKGVPGDRIHIEYYGETKPLAPEDTLEGHAKNRRVAIRFIDHK